MFKTMLSNLGKESATIDLVLDRDSVTMGETVTGTVYVTGGESEQRINEISVDFKVLNGAHQSRTVCQIPVTRRGFLIQPGEKRSFPFQFTCPENIPYSDVKRIPGQNRFEMHPRGTVTQYYFSTHLDIRAAKDTQDVDPINVLPSGLIKNFMEGFWLLGFENEEEGYDFKYQKFLFRPTRWMAGVFDEIFFAYEPGKAKEMITGIFELDKSTEGMGIKGKLVDKLDLDEKKGVFTFPTAELATPEKAAETIRVSRKIFHNIKKEAQWKNHGHVLCMLM